MTIAARLTLPAARLLLAAARPLLRAAGMQAAAASLQSSPAYPTSAISEFMKSWLTVGSDIDSLVESYGEELRSKANDLCRKVPWASGAIESWESYSVGSGIVPVFMHSDEAEARRLSELWLRSTDEIDASGSADAYGQQAQVAGTEFRAGEVFARRRLRLPKDGLAVPMQVQLIEPEQVPLNHSNMGGMGGNKVRAGIEYDAIGRRAAYHMLRDHPGSSWSTDSTPRRIPADSVAHVYKILRPGQQRGMTAFAPVIGLLYKIEKYDDAELIRKGLTAMFAFFVRGTGGIPTMSSSMGSDSLGVLLQGVSPGSVYDLQDKDITAPHFPDVGGMYGEYMSALLHKAAAGLRSIPYHVLTGDLKESTFSSARQDLIKFYRLIDKYQHQTLVFQYMRPVMRWWLEAAVMGGQIDAGRYERERAEYQRIIYRTPAREWVDPMKDFEAKQGMVRAGFISRESVCTELGEDAVLIDQQNAVANERADGLGLSYDSDGRRPLRGGAETKPKEGQAA